MVVVKVVLKQAKCNTHPWDKAFPQDIGHLVSRPVCWIFGESPIDLLRAVHFAKMPPGSGWEDETSCLELS